MTSAYGTKVTNQDSVGRDYADRLPYLPLQEKLSNGTTITIDFVRDHHDADAVRTLLNDVIEEGTSWPFETPLSDVAFRSYFFSHTALVARCSVGDVIGAFYCKPNFPGRCSHYCNGGFITDSKYRRQGVASVMGAVFLRVAKDLGFRAVLFNLVFTSNEASIRLWEKLGFQKLALLPGVGRLRNGTFDAVQYYYDLENMGTRQRQDLWMRLSSQIPRVCIIAFAFFAGRFSVRRST